MKILKVFLSIIIILSFILVGTPIEYNCFELNLSILLIGTVFGIYKIFIKKEKVIDKKIDWIVLIFYLAPIIPMMFGTCNSLEETLIALVRNISLFNIYAMAKGLILIDKKQGDLIINILIAGGVLLVLLGIDERLTKIMFQYVRYLGIPPVANIESRMFSTLGYANSFAIIMAIEIMLCFNKLKHNKVLYSGLIYLFLLGMLLSYSRSVIAMFIIIFIIYIASVKRKRIYLIYNFLQNIIITLASMKIFEFFREKNQYILAWISIIFFAILSILIANMIRKKYKRICKIKLKTYIKIAVFSIILIISIFFIGKQMDIPIHVFENGRINRQVKYKLYNIEEKEYIFKFDIDAMVIEDTAYKPYTILINEENKYYDTIESHSITFGQFKGIKEIKFKPSNETLEIAIYINSNFPRYQNGLTIKSLYINNEKFALKYAFLPIQLVERIESFNLNNKSLWERFVFSKDALKIIKENMLFGLGAKGWQYNYEEIQSYQYSTTEVHNFALQLFIENGIIGFSLLVIIILYVIIKILKEKKINEIDFAFIILILHSIVDFDLSFYVIMVIWILLFTLSTQNNRTVNNKTKNTVNWQVAILVLNIVIFCTGIFTYKIKSDNENMLEEISYAVKANEDNKVIELIKKFREDKKNKIFIYDELILIDYSTVETENLEYVYNLIKNDKIVANTKYNIDRNRIMKKVITTSTNEEMIEKFCNIIIEENDLMILNIKDREKNRLTKGQIDSYLETQKQIYEVALEKI